MAVVGIEEVELVVLGRLMMDPLAVDRDGERGVPGRHGQPHGETDHVRRGAEPLRPRATSKQRYQKVVWALAVTETLHNLEEAIWLPDWSKAAGPWHSAVGAFEFRFAVVVVTLFVYAIIYQFWRRSTAWSRYFMAGALVLILLNVLVPHLLATLMMTRYAPGVVTGVLLNVPVTVYLLRRGIRERIFGARDLAIGTAVVGAILLPLLPMSFALGRVVEVVAVP